MASSPLDPTHRSIATVLVDDEPAARRRLRAQLSAFPELRIEEEFDNTETLSAYLTNNKVDLIFLDIQMPGESGLDLAKRFPKGPRPVLVFVTAFEEHAVEAFSVAAADYLLKPVTAERLAQCVERVRLLCQAEAEGVANETNDESNKPLLNRIVVPSGERLMVVTVQQIDWIESAGNYAIIHVGRDTHVLRETLTSLDSRLDKNQFMRISRSTIVNLNRTRELRATGGGGHEMVLADGIKLPITRGIREVQQRLETGDA